MYRFRYVMLVVAVLALASMACLSAGATGSGGGSAPALEELPEGHPSDGEVLFAKGGDGIANCSACHSLDGDSGVGPSLSGISDRAGGTKADLSAEAYIYESITNPDAYVVDGFHSSIMPSEFGHVLSPQQLADLVSFLMTQ